MTSPTPSYSRASFIDLLKERDRLKAECEALRKALEAITVWSRNGEQLCFRSANGVPMGMSKRLERIASQALGPKGRSANPTNAAGHETPQREED